GSAARIGSPGQPGDGRTRRNLCRFRLQCRHGAGDRGRLAQLHRAQHARKPPGAGHARHLLFSAPRPRTKAHRRSTRAPNPAEDAHEPGTSAHDAERRRKERGGRTDTDHRAGPGLSQRQRRDAHADVPPGRRPRHRSRHPPRAPQVDARDFPQGLLRARGHRAAAAAELLPVHRAFGRSRRRLRDRERPGWQGAARARRQRRCAGARLDGAARQRHGQPPGNRNVGARPRRVAGFCVRGRRRPAGDAEIRDGRLARVLRRRCPLAQALRVQRLRPADALGRSRSARMKFSLAWLQQYLETEAGAAEIAAKLNALGIEVEGLQDPAERLAGFRVARVLTAAPHPNADKLQVLTVDNGVGEPLQIVCGAPNARAGLVGVLGTAGAVVPAGGFELKKSAIRGIESNGMMCSARELALGEDHAGISELPEDAPVGTAFAEYRGTSPVFDVAITPNRPDCMGVYGIARDLAAAGMGTLKPPRIEPVAGAFPCPVEIRTDDPEGCPAFYGRVIRGVRNGPSPEWLQSALRDAGQRPISALVDLTNYLMLGFGRPAHAYDLAKLSGAVVARRAREGEQVLALNEKTYTLTPEMTVIADERQVHDIAG